VLEQLQVPVAQVREQLGIASIDVATARSDRLGLAVGLPAHAAGGAAQPVDPVDGAAARDISGPEYEGIRATAPTALRALGLQSGLTHLEWFRRPDGTVAVSEVAVRPPAPRSPWCMAASRPPERSWAVGTVFPRGQGTRHVLSCPCTASTSCRPR
jgi:hypothetical protein